MITMPKKLYTSLPTNYAVCQHADCPMAETCLHQIAYAELLAKEEILRVVNPSKCSKDDQCKHYRCSKPVRFARGFTGFKKRMYPDQYDKFMWTLIMHFGRNQYFKRRRGDILISPEEQDIIRGVLRKVGADDTMDFDSYEEQQNW